MECELNSHENLLRQLREPVPPLGKLIAVPSLPTHCFARAEPLWAYDQFVVEVLSWRPHWE